MAVMHLGLVSVHHLSVCLQVMRKKLKDKDAELLDSRAEIQQRVNELATKDRVIEERDAVVSELQLQVAQLRAELQSPESAASFTADTEVGASEQLLSTL